MSSRAVPSGTQDQQNIANEYEDCTPCRVLGMSFITVSTSTKCSYCYTGASTFIGLGVYSLTLPREHFTTSDSNAVLRTVTRFAPQLRAGMGGAFILAGIYRLVI